MTDPADFRFFTALQQVFAETGNPGEEACRAAVDQAVSSGAPLDLRAARLQIDALPDNRRDSLLAQVHARMASDFSAIWDLLPFTPGTQKTH
jgi:hypothetical protein